MVCRGKERRKHEVDTLQNGTEGSAAVAFRMARDTLLGLYRVAAHKTQLARSSFFVFDTRCFCLHFVTLI